MSVKKWLAAGLFSVLCASLWAADIPPASDAFREQYIKENTDDCVQGIESTPDLRATYSHQTVVVYCTCRQRYSADVIAQAIKQDKRGKKVVDAAADYAREKCRRILLEQLEQE